jgi:hypothetical protein
MVALAAVVSAGVAAVAVLVAALLPAPIPHIPRVGWAHAREEPILAVPRPTDAYLANHTRHHLRGEAVGQETVVISDSGRMLLFTADGWVRQVADLERGDTVRLARIGGRVLGAAFVPGSATRVVACDVAKGLIELLLPEGAVQGVGADVTVTLLTAASDDGQLITYCDDVAIAGG